MLLPQVNSRSLLRFECRKHSFQERSLRSLQVTQIALTIMQHHKTACHWLQLGGLFWSVYSSRPLLFHFPAPSEKVCLCHNFMTPGEIFLVGNFYALRLKYTWKQQDFHRAAISTQKSTTLRPTNLTVSFRISAKTKRLPLRVSTWS